MLSVNSAAHFLVDALCVTALFSAGAEGSELTLAVILYNTLAFSTQCVFGLLIDRFDGKYDAVIDVGAMLLVICGWLLPAGLIARVCVFGLGNSLFHTAGGKMTLRCSGGRAGPLGVFVAPGAFGVTLGTVYPLLGNFLCAALALCAAAVVFARLKSPRMPETQCAECGAEERFPLASVILLTLAVAVRAVGGAAVSFSWKTGAGMAFLMTAFVFAGKFLGGFVCDRIGAKRMAYLTVPLAAVCIAFFSAYAVPSLLGQFLLNLTMPVTLWLLYRAMPDSPGFAFGLAASALWPGTIAGMLFQLTGPALWVCVILSFVFGLFAILYSAKDIKRTERIGSK